MNELEQKYIDSREVAGIKNPKCLYVLLKRIVNSFSTNFCSNAYEIETELKKRLSYCQLEGEWYKEDFEKITTIATYLFVEMKKIEPKEEQDGIGKLLDFIFS